MARLPSHVIAKITARVPYGQDGIWQVARELQSFCLGDLMERVTADRRTITGYLDRLEKAGFITRKTPGEARWNVVIADPETPRLAADGARLPVPGRGQDSMWRTMKMLDTFDTVSLATAASLPDAPVKASTAQRYLTLLHAAGYLIVVSPPRPGRQGRTVYALDPARNTGPRAPQIQATDCVYDPNTATVHDIDGETRREV